MSSSVGAASANDDADEEEEEETFEEEEVWVTETSETRAVFYTETIKTVTTNERGEEVVQERTRVIGPDGNEVPPEDLVKAGYKL